MKLNDRLPPAGEHPVKRDAAELDLQVVNIVNGYRQPKLLRVETGTAAREFGDARAADAFLRQALRKMEQIEKKKRFRRETAAPALSSATAAVRARPEPACVASVDKTAFFSRLALAHVPLEEVFQMPKLGMGLFLQKLLEQSVPAPRALWAARVAYANVSSAELVRELLEKAVRGSGDVARQAELAQSLLALMVGENVCSAAEVVECALRRELESLDRPRRVLLAQLAAPFLSLLYTEKPVLAASQAARLRELGLVDPLPRLARCELSLFDGPRQTAEAAAAFLRARYRESRTAAAAAVAGAFDQQPFCGMGSVAEWAVMGLFEFGEELQKGREHNIVVRHFAAEYVLSVARHLRKASRQQIWNGLFLFSQRRHCRFSALLWSELIRASVVSYGQFMRLVTLSAVASCDPRTAEFALKISCPPSSRADRALGDAPFHPEACGRFLHTLQSFLDRGEFELLRLLFEDMCDFDLDLLLPELRRELEREFCLAAAENGGVVVVSEGMSAEEYARIGNRLQRWMDVCLMFPGGLSLAEWLVESLDRRGSLSPCLQGLVVSAMSRLWYHNVCPSVRSRLQAAFSASSPSSSSSSSPPSRNVVLSWDDADNCVAVANRGLPVSSHALSALALALHPGLARQLAMALPSFDSLCFMGGSDLLSKWTQSADFRLDLWKNAKRGPPIDAFPAPLVLQETTIVATVEERPRWEIASAAATVSGPEAKKMCLAIGERIFKERVCQSVKMWFALNCLMKRLTEASALAHLCVYTVSSALTPSSHALLSRPETAFLVGQVCGQFPADTFEKCMAKISQPDEVCLVGLEKVLPVGLAAFVQARVPRKPAEEDPFLVEGRMRSAMVLREPQNVVRGWTVTSGRATNTLLAKSLGTYEPATPGAESDLKRAKKSD